MVKVRLLFMRFTAFLGSLELCEKLSRRKADGILLIHQICGDELLCRFGRGRLSLIKGMAGDGRSHVAPERLHDDSNFAERAINLHFRGTTKNALIILTIQQSRFIVIDGGPIISLSDCYS
jgi:hypothetical protein